MKRIISAIIAGIILLGTSVMAIAYERSANTIIYCPASVTCTSTAQSSCNPQSTPYFKIELPEGSIIQNKPYELIRTFTVSPTMVYCTYQLKRGSQIIYTSKEGNSYATSGPNWTRKPSGIWVCPKQRQGTLKNTDCPLSVTTD